MLERVMEMTKELILNTLSCSAWEIEENCRKLDVLYDYWKLIVFDSHVDNLYFMDFNKSFGRYQIWGIADYKHAFAIDRQSLEKKWQVVLYSTCVNFDSNVSSYISSMVHKQRIDEDLIKLLQFIKSKKYQTTCQHYCLELAYNDAPIKEQAIFETLYANSVIEQMTETQLKRKDFESIILKEEEYVRIKSAVDNIKRDKGKEWERFYILYALILKTFLIRHEDNKSTKHKVSKLLEFIISDIGVYAENETYICAKYIDKDKEVEEFFRHIQKGRNSDRNIKDIKSMVWDLLHLRNLIDEMRVRNTKSDICFLHCFASYERGLMDLVKINPVQRMLYIEDQMICKYKHNVFDIEGCQELRNEFMEKFESHEKNQNIKQLCVELEEEIRTMV